MKLEIRKIGDATALILPDVLLARLGLAVGANVFATEEPNGDLTLSTNEDHRDKVLTIARKVFRDYGETFKALAK